MTRFSRDVFHATPGRFPLENVPISSLRDRRRHPPPYQLVLEQRHRIDAGERSRNDLKSTRRRRQSKAHAVLGGLVGIQGRTKSFNLKDLTHSGFQTRIAFRFWRPVLKCSARRGFQKRRPLRFWQSPPIAGVLPTASGRGFPPPAFTRED